MGVWLSLSVHARVALLFSPGHEPIVELLKAGDALGLGLEQKPLSNVAGRSSVLVFRDLAAVWPAVDEANAEHGGATASPTQR